MDDEYEAAKAATEEYTASAGEAIDKLLEQNETLEAQKAILTGNTASEEGNTAAKGANTVQEGANTASKKGNTVATGAKTVATNADTLATERNTLSQKFNAIQMKASAVASRIWTVAIGQMKAAWDGLKVAIMTNPIGVALGAISLVLPWIMQWASDTDEAKTKTEEYGEAADKAASKVESMFNVLNAASSSSKVYRDAVSQLKQQFDEYGIKLDETAMKGDDEIAKVEEMKKHHQELTDVIRQEAIERERANGISQNNKDYEEKTETLKDTTVEKFSDQFNDAEKAQLAGLVGADDLKETLELYKEYLDLAQKARDGEASRSDVQLAWNAYNESVKEATESVDRFTQRTKADGVARYEAREAIEEQARGLVQLMLEQERANDETNNAAQAAEEAKNKNVDLAESFYLNKKSISEIKDELKTLVSTYKKTSINIDIFYKQHDIPEWMKGFSSANAKKNAAAYAKKARQLKDAGDEEGSKKAMQQSLLYTKQAEAAQKKEERKQKRADIKDRMKNAKTRNDWKGIQQDINTGLNDAEIGSEEEKAYKSFQDQVSAKLKSLSGSGGKKGGRSGHNPAEDAAKERQRQFNLRMKEAEQEAAQEQAAADALEKARIAKIVDNGERQRAEEDNL